MNRFTSAFVLPLSVAAMVTSCGPASDRGPVEVAIIGGSESLFEQGVRLSPAGQHMRASTNEGLVALDPTGQVVPAIAERWIVTDDGLSYIFRLRDSDWPDGEEITAEQVRSMLRETIRRLDGTSLGLDLAKLTEVRAMTGRVVELRLSSPMPDFLRLLAQPELGFARSGSGAGPMIVSRDEDVALARLNAIPPENRGLPVREDWEESSRSITVRALPGEAAVEAFSEGEVDLVLNGTIATFPLAQVGPLSRGSVQVDPAQGLFGFLFRSDDGFLSDPSNREALSMALDRTALIQPFSLGGWQSTTWIVPPGLFVPAQYPASRWSDLNIGDRREVARSRVAAWTSRSGENAVVRVGIPQGVGGDLLFDQVAESWQLIGVTARRAAAGDEVDIELRDRLARYNSPRWYLNQFNCRLNLGLCSPAADALLRESLSQRDPTLKQNLLAEAHAELVAAEVFIPLGVPVRWSMVRGTVNGYEANQWGVHPLFPLSQPTT